MGVQVSSQHDDLVLPVTQKETSPKPSFLLRPSHEGHILSSPPYLLGYKSLNYSVCDRIHEGTNPHTGRSLEAIWEVGYTCHPTSDLPHQLVPG